MKRKRQPTLGENRPAISIVPPRFPRLPGWFLGLLLMLATFLAYQPAWNGQPLWDDDAHMTKSALHSLSGLAQIWTDPKATQQYYPLVHSVFWVEHHLWGDSIWGYHLVNIFLHSFAAILFFKILRRLAIPGAYLAAAVFALHPAHVESVAWISELKNVLSGVFYLGAALAYLKFDATRKRKFYWAALGLFVAGLLCKTVIATLPAAMLVIFWWKRGKLNWQKDALPLAPFFVLGITAGLFTVWVERKYIGAEGADFNFSLMERCLIAGRAIWFYLGKLFWPANLIFNYPRWNISHAIWWQYLFPMAALLLAAGLAVLSRKRRGPLAAFLFFAGTLFPALGFFNVYPFRYSFVADHFQYLASLGIIALACAAVVHLLDERRLWERTSGNTICAALVMTLAILTWRQAHIYKDPETLWRDTLAKNPDSALAHNNFGLWLDERGNSGEAISHFQKLLKLHPGRIDGYINYGVALLKQNKPDEAMAKYREALRIDPNFAMAHYNMAKVFEQQGNRAEEESEYKEALRLDPGYYQAHHNLSVLYIKQERLDAALPHVLTTIKLKPDHGDAYRNLGLILHQNGQTHEAIAQYEKALQLNSKNVEALIDLGVTLAEQGRFAKARQHYLAALQIEPTNVEARNNLANLALYEKRYDEALRESLEALRLDPQFAPAHYNAGNALYLLGRLDEAAVHYEQALRWKPDYEEARNNLNVVLKEKEQK